MKPKILKITALIVGTSLGCFLIGVFLYHRVHVGMERAFLARFDTGEILEVEGATVNYKIFKGWTDRNIDAWIGRSGFECCRRSICE